MSDSDDVLRLALETECENGDTEEPEFVNCWVNLGWFSILDFNGQAFTSGDTEPDLSLKCSGLCVCVLS